MNAPVQKKKKKALPHLKSICDGEFLPELIILPGGEFEMGCSFYSAESPARKVSVATFAIGKYPVTQRQWTHLMGSNPSWFSDGDQADSCPVEQVTWDDAQEYIAAINKKTKRKKMKYRLPTEAEWEYACRANSVSQWHFGNAVSQLGKYAWYYGNSEARTHPVGEKKPNEFGLHDMHGNVWEWCEDRWHKDYVQAPANAIAWDTGTTDDRVVRGGSWLNLASNTRSTQRNLKSSDLFFNNFGFRLALGIE